jgi:hypothetical protein
VKMIFWAALAWPMIALIRAGVKPLAVGALRIMGNKTPAPGPFGPALRFAGFNRVALLARWQCACLPVAPQFALCANSVSHAVIDACL